MSRHTDSYDQFYLTQFDGMVDTVSTWPNANYYLPKFQRLRNEFLEKGCKAYAPDPNHFNTLIHGDLYVYFFHLLNFFSVISNQDDLYSKNSIQNDSINEIWL